MRGKKPPADNRLINNPFKSLKGLSDSDLPKLFERATIPKQSEDEKKVSSRPEPPVADDELFRQEMEWLGVSHRPGKDQAVPSRKAGPSAENANSPEVLSDEDELLFQHAVGRMDTTFSEDDKVEPDPLPGPRRARQLKQGKVKPEAQIDLHGLSRQKALTQVNYFLENSRHHGFHCVLIITGKGARSSGGAVLRSAVLDWLAANREGVLEWIEAPRQLGGSGALVVFLRRPPHILRGP